MKIFPCDYEVTDECTGSSCCVLYRKIETGEGRHTEAWRHKQKETSSLVCSRAHIAIQADLHSLMSLPHAMWSLGVSVLTAIQYGNLLLIVAFARVVFVVYNLKN